MEEVGRSEIDLWKTDIRVIAWEEEYVPPLADTEAGIRILQNSM